jgi:CAAX protease family protein
MSATSNPFKTFATRYPFFFALAFFVVSLCLALVISTVGRLLGSTAGAGIVELVVQSLLALGVLVWLGWLRTAGFNGPSQWRSLYLLWLPALLALFYLSSFYVTPVSGIAVVIFAAMYALLTGLSEEASFRGVMLQALLPYGRLQGAALSGLFFGLFHLNNLLAFGPSLIVFAQVIGAFFLGFGFAACRLRTNTIWPFIIFHACYDLTTDITLFNVKTVAATGSSLFSPVTVAIFLIIPGFLLACYGLFLLRPRQQPAQKLKTLTEQ